MKVAIIGAGPSGLACAIELERNGIYPVIFERNSFIGEYYPYVSAFLGMMTRPIADPVRYINKTLGIRLEPLSQVIKIIHHSPNNQVSVKGSLGHFVLRGKEDRSFQRQLLNQVKSQVHFGTFVQPEDLEDEFDSIVVADGHWSVPKRYGIWQEVIRTWIKGGIFAGDFEDHTIQMWLDNELTNGAYIYLAPFDKHKAGIIHVVQNIEHEELNGYWQRFLSSYGILNKYNLLESWELPQHAGFVTTNKVGKTYFIGATGGGVESLLGFGQFTAVVSGVMAGRSIVQGADINLLMRNLKKRNEELYRIRRLMNTTTNRQLDWVLALMKTPGLRSLVYNTNIDVIKHFSNCIKYVSGFGKR